MRRLDLTDDQYAHVIRLVEAEANDQTARAQRMAARAPGVHAREKIFDARVLAEEMRDLEAVVQAAEVIS